MLFSFYRVKSVSEFRLDSITLSSCILFDKFLTYYSCAPFSMDNIISISLGSYLVLIMHIRLSVEEPWIYWPLNKFYLVLSSVIMIIHWYHLILKCEKYCVNRINFRGFLLLLFCLAALGLRYSTQVLASCNMWRSCLAAWGILVPQQGMEPRSPALEGEFSTTGAPGGLSCWFKY